MRRRGIWIALGVAVVIGLLCWLPRSRHASATPGSPPAPTAGSAAAGAAVSPGAASYAAEERSHLADSLDAPASNIGADLRTLNAIFVQYRSATHGENPVGENDEITAALTGRNKLQFAFIPKDCPAIDTKGELCDRWGTPYFFHQLSGTQMEIRSAGPDRKMWTQDDVVLTPGRGEPPL